MQVNELHRFLDNLPREACESPQHPTLCTICARVNGEVAARCPHAGKNSMFGGRERPPASFENIPLSQQYPVIEVARSARPYVPVEREYRRSVDSDAVVVETFGGSQLGAAAPKGTSYGKRPMPVKKVKKVAQPLSAVDASESDSAQARRQSVLQPQVAPPAQGAQDSEKARPKLKVKKIKSASAQSGSSATSSGEAPKTN